MKITIKRLKMKTDVTTEKGCRKTVVFELEKDELEKFRKTSFEKLKKTAKIDGFRPGKAPESIVRQRFGASIETDAVNEAVDHSLKEFLTENGIYPLSRPEMSDIKKDGDNLSFTVSFDIYPEFELKKHQDITVEHAKKEITGQDVDNAVNELLDKYSSSKEIDTPVSVGNIVEVSIRPVGGSDSDWETKIVEIGKNPDDRIDKEFTGLNKNDIKTIDLSSGDEDKNDHKFEVRIDKISEKILPEFDDDFAKSYNSRFQTADELKDHIEKDLKSKNELDTETAVYDKIASKIIEEHESFDVPDSVLSKYLDDIVTNTRKQYGNSIDPKTVRDLYEKNARMSLKWQYLRNRILEENKLKVSDEDVENRLSEISQESGIDAEKVKQYYSGKEKAGMLKEDILERKLRKFLILKNEVKYTEE